MILRTPRLASLVIACLAISCTPTNFKGKKAQRSQPAFSNTNPNNPNNLPQSGFNPDGSPANGGTGVNNNNNNTVNNGSGNNQNNTPPIVINNLPPKQIQVDDGGNSSAPGVGTGNNGAGTGFSNGSNSGDSNNGSPTSGAAGPKTVYACSSIVSVPGYANPYMAGMPTSTVIRYPGQDSDRGTREGAILITPQDVRCIQPNAKLFFEVNGSLSNGGDFGLSAADGNVGNIVNHQLGALHGKSDVRAPLASLVGVFLGNQSPNTLPAPGTLSFASAAEREQTELRPSLQQIFFIGDGKRSDGTFQRVIVPAGATRLFLGTMDVFEWTDNKGRITAGILWDPN